MLMLQIYIKISFFLGKNKNYLMKGIELKVKSL